MSNCNCCPRRIVSTGIGVSGANLEISTNVAAPLDLETKYCLVLAQPIPGSGANLPVYVTIAGTNIPVKRYGIGRIEYGANLPQKSGMRIPVIFNGAGELCDMRQCENSCGGCLR